MAETQPSFRELAERRLEVLEQRERERQVRAEARAAEQRAGQAADRERRQHAQQQAAEQAATEARTRLARRFGIAAQRVNLAAEYRLFLIAHRNVAIAYRRPARAHHPGGRAPRADQPAEASSWSLQLALQRELGAGVDGPMLVRGDQILGYATDVDRLVVDPEPGELAALNPNRGTT